MMTDDRARIEGERARFIEFAPHQKTTYQRVYWYVLGAIDGKWLEFAAPNQTHGSALAMCQPLNTVAAALLAALARTPEPSARGEADELLDTLRQAEELISLMKPNLPLHIRRNMNAQFDAHYARYCRVLAATPPPPSAAVLAERVEKLVEALEYYADHGNWFGVYTTGPGLEDDWGDPTEEWPDGKPGNRARAALAALAIRARSISEEG